MRILTRKIYRAYPELDKFEDDVCKRYVKRAKRINNAWKGWALIIVALPTGFVLWAALSWATAIFMSGLEAQYNLQLFDPPSTILMLIFFTGFVWFPVLLALLIRDRWLHRCLRKQLTGVQCPSCGYSLLGLTLADGDGSPAVNCPECGIQTVLKDMGLTESDIDPSRIEVQV